MHADRTTADEPRIHAIGVYLPEKRESNVAMAERFEFAGDFLEKKLGVQMGETTSDGLFTLQQCECLGACADAPVMLVNDRTMCSFMDNDKLDQLVDGLRAAEGQA